MVEKFLALSSILVEYNQSKNLKDSAGQNLKCKRVQGNTKSWFSMAVI